MPDDRAGRDPGTRAADDLRRPAQLISSACWCSTLRLRWIFAAADLSGRERAGIDPSAIDCIASAINCRCLLGLAIAILGVFAAADCTRGERDSQSLPVQLIAGACWGSTLRISGILLSR